MASEINKYTCEVDRINYFSNTFESKTNAAIPKTLLEESLQTIAEHSAGDFQSLIGRVKLNLPLNDFQTILKQKIVLLKILYFCPESILDLSTEDNYGMMGQKYISECACSDLARDKHSARSELEDGLLQSIQTHFKNVNELNIMSLGAGGCFQELVIHAKITYLFKIKINWILVDPIHSSKKNNVFSEFKNLISLLSPDSSVYHIKDDEEAIAQLQQKICPQPNIFLNIDSRLSKILTYRNGNSNIVQSKLNFFLDAVSQLNIPYMFAVLEDQKPQFIVGNM
jgi:hypothetical protein